MKRVAADDQTNPSPTLSRTQRGATRPDTVDETVGEQLVCTTCGAVVPEGSRSCPVCHRGVYRTCFCGWQLPANRRLCPNCGADWSQSARVARKSRSRTPRTRKLVRHALLGALVAAAATIVVIALLTVLARLGMGDETEMPIAVGDRLALAVAGVGRLLRLVGAFLARYGPAILSVIGIMIVGAVVGVFAYLRKNGHHEQRTSRTSRRVRRTRRQ